MPVPLVWPRTGSRGDALRDAVSVILNEATSINAVGYDRLPAYLDWAVSAVNWLQPHIVSRDIDRLIRTPAFWSAVGLAPNSSIAGQLINAELRERQEELRRTLASIEELLWRFTDVPASSLVLVPDTNVLMAHAGQARSTDWRAMVSAHVQPLDPIRLVIPLVVVDELDRLKDHSNPKTRSRASASLKLLHELLGDNPSARPVLREGQVRNGPISLEVLAESPRHVRLPRNDDELVDVTARLNAMVGGRAVLTTFDTGADFRAAIAGVKHVRLEHAYALK